MKARTYQIIALGFAVILLFFGFWNLAEDRQAIGWISIGFCACIFLYLFMNNKKKVKIPFPVIKKKYIQEMDQQEKVSINPLAKVEELAEEGSRYCFVLRQTIDAIPHYYMCEADMYEGTMGRGFGTYTTKQSEALHFYQSRKKSDINQILKSEVTRNMVREILINQKKQEAELLSRNQQPQGEFK